MEMKITIDYLIHKFGYNIPYTEDEKVGIIEQRGNKYIACDNTDGCCFVEEFNDYESAHYWLSGDF